MRTAIVIPARYASKRLPGKPLLRSTGKYLIEHVYERACQARSASVVVVATDDPRIASAVAGFGGNCVMTRREHPSGTDRVAEVAEELEVDCVINLQGDEPEIAPSALDQLPALLDRDPTAGVATLAVPITDEETYRDPNCVKVVCSDEGRALYFSRSPIPHVRDGRPNFAARPANFLQHVGIYAYRRDVLMRLAATSPAALEGMEKLEQLRALAGGWAIQVGIINHASRGVDTFDDYEHFVASYARRRRARARAA
jgi:3-deoxy-manno-octulosonate cytidylyltransferase (CMP-KDO synthetase)